jgi:hypothetical protein
MMRATGLCGALLVTVSQVLALPEVHVLEAGVVVGLAGAIAVLWRSPGLAIAASVAALLVFSLVLLFAPPGGHVVEAVLLGIGLLVLLDGAYFELRFRTTETSSEIATDHLRSLSSCVLLTAILALLTTAASVVIVEGLNASLRSIIATFGGIIIVVAIVWKARLARAGTAPSMSTAEGISKTVYERSPS